MDIKNPKIWTVWVQNFPQTVLFIPATNADAALSIARKVDPDACKVQCYEDNVSFNWTCQELWHYQNSVKVLLDENDNINDNMEQYKGTLKARDCAIMLARKTKNTKTIEKYTVLVEYFEGLKNFMLSNKEREE